jgi:hypothetical protein
MKKTLLLSLFILATLFAQAQKPLTNSRTSSLYTYVYKLNDDATLQFLAGKHDLIKQEELNNEVAKYLTDKPQNVALPPGNYLKVTAVENKLKYALIQKHNANLILLANGTDLRFILLDNDSREISDAIAYRNSKLIPYDKDAETYHISRSKKDTLIKVNYKGVINFFNLNERYVRKYRDYDPDRKPVKNKLGRLWQKATEPIIKLFKKPSLYRAPAIQTNPGFMVFNKPKYRPGDTVKFKAFILQKKSMRPINDKRLAIRLKDYYRDNGKIIGYVNAYRDGGFNYQFKLTDSLKLRLGSEYTISLETLDSKKYDTDSYDGDRPDWEILDKRTVYQEDVFKYEDYELKTNRFNVRVDRREASPGMLTSVYFKATDDNDLIIPDGRVKMTLFTIEATDFGAPHVFVPDTLWQHELILDPIGETKFTLPDSIFPKANIRYNARFTLLNSNNESLEKLEYLQWYHAAQIIATKVEHDTLSINYMIAGKNFPITASITRVGTRNDTLGTATVSLPAKIVIAPNITTYIIKADTLTKKVWLYGGEGDDIQTLSYRTKDSLFIRINNPRNTKFWYTIYTGNKLFESGTATRLIYQKPFKYTGRVSVLVNSVWAGESISKEDIVPLLDHFLNVEVQQPVSVYPGQQADIEINVKDKTGKAVANADITAYAVTKKFDNYKSVTPPYLGSRYKNRPFKQDLLFKRLVDTGRVKLDWQYQSRQMGLDTITYYKFTHPDTLYSITESAPDSLTQVAPFVVKDGEILPVHILYIDEKPVYFSQSQDLQRYSFAVTPGTHSLRFRTVDKSIRLDNVTIPRGQKLILSVNSDEVQNPKLNYRKMPEILGDYEANLVNKYMISIVPNFNEYMATLQQGDKVFLMNGVLDYYNNYNYRTRKTILAGPFNGSSIDLTIKGGFMRNFIGEGGYSFEFQPDLIKQKSLDVRYPFNTQLKLLPGNSNYRQYPLTIAETDNIWSNYLDNRAHYAYKFYGGNTFAKLLIKVAPLKKGETPFVKNILVYKKDDPNFLQIYPGNNIWFYNLQPDRYRLLFLLKGNSYYLLDNVIVKSRGVSFYSTADIPIHAPDSVSLKIAKLTAIPSLQYIDRKTTNAIKGAFNEKFLDMKLFPGEIMGYVYDAETGEPLTGSTISIGGKGIVQADIDGYFRINGPSSNKLTFSNIGYETLELKVEKGQLITVKLKPGKRSLNEVVIRGYVRHNRDETTGSSYIVSDGMLKDVASLNVEKILQGGAAGLNIQNNARIRSSTVNVGSLSVLAAGAGPLYVVDGIKVKLNDKDFVMPADDMIASKSTLTAEAAMAIYGPEAVNGAVVIVTKKAANDQQAQSLRRNFSDYAYWQPRLTTNADGKVKFKVTYPDDITSWRTFVIGATATRQSGFSEGVVRSFKPVSANFVSPLFAVKGDKFSVLGKALNYTTDTLMLNRTFSYDGKIIADGNITLQNARIDTFRLVAAGIDTLNFEYAIKRGNGYFDGEKRTIPLFEQGSLETKGSFDVLEKDTTITIQTSPGLKEATLRAEASVFPALLDETEHLRNYEYLCNEQLASKLKGLLAEKQIRSYLGQPFKGDNDIKDIIKKLMESRNAEGTWGWWKGTEEELWITLHVMEALVKAESKGFAVAVDKRQLGNYLVLRLDFYNGPDRLTDIMLLRMLNPTSNLKIYVTNYESNLSLKVKQSDLERYRLMYARQLVGMQIAIDSLLKDMKRTMFGNVYWGSNGYNFFNNSIQLSLMAYRILKAEGNHATLLTKLRNYFLEQRASGNWRNTYESAAILETILPDLMVNGQQPKPATLKISGDKTETVTEFPYTTTLSAGAKVTVSKTGDMPVYLTAYQKFWNPEPAKVSGDFIVNTWFTKSDIKVTKIKGGQSITLTAEVIVKADADFVMIEIPIPAGCSYESKDQGYYGGEVHREYFKNKVSIFCRKLTVGTYRYNIKLLPRYGGNYHLNPAKAEMMYFPVFYGREGMKMFEIGD